LYGQCRAGAQIIFPESGRGLGHVTPTILAVRSAILATAWLLVIVYFSSTTWVEISLSAITSAGNRGYFDSSKSLVMCGNN